MATTVISLGGSLIIPKGIDSKFLTEFKKHILNHIKKNHKVAIITGGGSISRIYSDAMKNLAKVGDEELDWIGVAATKLNAEFIRVLFQEQAYEHIITNPTEHVETDKPVMVGSGWKPGFSSDNDAVLLAKNLGSDTVINLSNIDYVYDKDPKKFKNARPKKKLSWEEFFVIVGTEWHPGSNLPFDPVAAKNAHEAGIRVVVMNGANLKNLDNFLKGKKFEGTLIE